MRERDEHTASAICGRDRADALHLTGRGKSVYRPAEPEPHPARYGRHARLQDLRAHEPRRPPTERGTIFLQHAKSILREMDSIEALGPRRPVANRLRICIPRSAAMLDLTSEFIATLPEDQNLDVAIRECHARKALELLANGEVEIGIIRFRSEYRDYFEEQMTQRGLNFEILSKYRYQILLCRDHPLAQKSVLAAERPGRPAGDRPRRHVPPVRAARPARQPQNLHGRPARAAESA